MEILKLEIIMLKYAYNFNGTNIKLYLNIKYIN